LHLAVRWVNEPGKIVARLTSWKAHPHEVLGQTGLDDSVLSLEDAALADERIDFVERVTQEIDGGGDECRCLSGKEIDDRVAGIGESKVGLLNVKVCGDTPKALFTCGPEAVDDVIGKAAFGFDALGVDQGLESGHASAADVFVVAAVSYAGVLKKDCGGHLWPVEAKVFFTVRKESVAGFDAEGVPAGAIVDRREGPVSVEGNKGSGDPVRTVGTSKEVTLLASWGSGVEGAGCREQSGAAEERGRGKEGSGPGYEVSAGGKDGLGTNFNAHANSVDRSPRETCPL